LDVHLQLPSVQQIFQGQSKEPFKDQAPPFARGANTRANVDDPLGEATYFLDGHRNIGKLRQVIVAFQAKRAHQGLSLPTLGGQSKKAVEWRQPPFNDGAIRHPRGRLFQAGQAKITAQLLFDGSLTDAEEIAGIGGIGEGWDGVFHGVSHQTCNG